MVGKLIVGILVGPAVLGWIENNEFIHYTAEIGVILLMFIAGLETDLEQLKQTWRSAFAVAVGGIILPFLGGYAVADAFGLDSNYALFMGPYLAQHRSVFRCRC
ncbi:Sodium/hydrogen exchanger family protein [Paenibacillus sp. CF384]|nr:Sodium/hydrogen exchanger family protein [Paenibacillus sp. CF384]